MAVGANWRVCHTKWATRFAPNRAGRGLGRFHGPVHHLAGAPSPSPRDPRDPATPATPTSPGVLVAGPAPTGECPGAPSHGPGPTAADGDITAAAGCLGADGGRGRTGGVPDG
ncbi:hypothetical protein P168DRAFT_322860 [Aspergillus campestris IBT 28561]|uniref:Uncharacterized protein n=1 Tax=Aspergillus campestris (strain IBT 28561) TaxID=1392248 RepID=A0A2I1CQ57_ASPC2|nr:uncharacterized protein P168DRAFT_322860 [Aspergillus campestris IBT 28561]PKX99749.1 hypothetical protein P168DRAFT_322860 [Aspergillus campestris IBT 28561]